MLNVLLVEDMEASVDNIELARKQIMKDNSIEFKFQHASCYEEGLAHIKRAICPLVILDLGIPCLCAGADYKGSKYPGVDLVPLVKKYNKNAIVGIYSANLSDTYSQLIEHHVDEYIPKNVGDNSLIINKLRSLVLKTYDAFNYKMKETRVDEALDSAFQNGDRLGSKEQWDLCLRRLLVSANDVRYVPLKKGFSGAGIAIASIDNYLPMVFKFGLYEQLIDEVNRYKRYVQRYIRYHASTSIDDLAQSAEIGILAYSFVGLHHNPKTLSDAINKKDYNTINEAISNYFKKNCEHWYQKVPGISVPYELSKKCRDHYKPSIEIITNNLKTDIGMKAVEEATKMISENDMAPTQLMDEIIEATNAERELIYCKRETNIHGDLNVRNLVWNDRHLWMIDYAKTGIGPRVIDFTKLESSLIYDDDDSERRSNDIENMKRIMKIIRLILNKFIFDTAEISSLQNDYIENKIRIIHEIRSCAVNELGDDKENEYWTSLFFTNVKYIEYLSKSVCSNPSMVEFKFDPLTQAIVSSFVLSRNIKETIRA